jgi:cellulose synthase/poly-beta-1,6-N-acetylglucosamine synthase-like glycosyltransferase
MPALRDQDRMIIGYDRFVFEVLFLGELLLGGLFILAVVLGIGRVLIVLLLALLALIRDLRHPIPIIAATNGPTVTVLVAAYNEGKVIARTMESIMKSRYAIKELIVIDDGSTDDTLSVARQALARIEGAKSKKRRIRIIHQQNAGKSAALNHGIEYATGDVLVCLDADTIAAPDAIGRLVAHFSDERVGGVAGNIKVGNRSNLLTKWQAIEYITSQNLDRRAGDLVNAVTVIPGALGAWRASAVREAGGFVTDTLAEDMDLTWRLRRAGYRMVNEGDAIGYTEAPDTYRAFIKQRMRWSFGSLQCLYKHHSALFRYGWFGRFALPSLWIFQFLFQVIAPLVDIQILFLAARFLNAYIASGLLQQDWQPLHAVTQDLLQFGFLYLLLFAVELLGAVIAFRLDRERLRALWSLPLQRILYRQILYLVIYHSLWKALSGMKQSWNKLQRRGNVQAA